MTTQRTRRSSGALGALALVALLGAGCAGGSDDTTRSGADTTAANSSSTSSGAGETTATTTARDMAIEFAECIREHDVEDFPDPNAASWLSEHGAAYGLCQIYDNEPWHYELRPDAVEDGCPATYADPSEDPRMQ